jgi:transglutaminase-like putative cysteine protease
MQANAVRPYQKWNWSGDEIVQSSTIPAARRVPNSRMTRYPIDIREFLSIEDNAVVRKWLQDLVSKLPEKDQLRFLRRGPGNFDFRAQVMATGLRRLDYIASSRSFDQWLFPEETLARKGGDCEDLAFVLAALLAASGISPYCIRLALGRIIDRTEPANPKSWDHAWVMYLRESGAWEILEPMSKVRDKNSRGGAAARRQMLDSVLDLEYVPHFVFNTSHLWRVRSPEHRASERLDKYLESRKHNFWGGFDPSFAAGVHFDIFDAAFSGMSTLELQAVKSVSLRVDVDVLSYDPRDHFDFAYIDESWRRVEQRLATKRLNELGLAGHAIADFYAHSVYGYIMKDRLVAQKLPRFDPNSPLPSDWLQYDFTGMDLPGCQKSAVEASKYWSGRLISGQWWRWYSAYPKDLRSPQELAPRRCLPDHDQLAVDAPNPKQGYRILPLDEYREQFRLRKQAAIEHLTEVYRSWKSGV